MSKHVVIWGAAFALVVMVVGLLSFGCGREEEAAAPEAMPPAAMEEAEVVVEEAAEAVKEAAEAVEEAAEAVKEEAVAVEGSEPKAE